MGKSRIANGRKLVVLSGSAKGTAFVLTKPEVKAGRESDNAICLKGKRVSRHHAVLVRDNGEYTLRDMSPRIGTLLNGRRTKEAHLKIGDRIRIGEIEMVYEAETATVPVIETAPAMAPAPVEEVVAPVMPVVAPEKELALELVTESPVPEQQDRVAELTRETERLVAEAKLGNEALESVRAQMQTQSDLQEELTVRLKVVSGENIALVTLNRELQAKVSELKRSAEEADRVEVKLTQEVERLVGEMKLANEAMESLRAQLQTRSDQQAELTERLGVVSQENAALTKTNGKLESKVSKLEASVAEAGRMKSELAAAEAALREMSEDLAKAREMVKPEPIQAALVEVPVQQNRIIDMAAPIAPIVVDSDEERIAAAKKQEEAVARRQVSEKTNEQFDNLRRTIVEKKNMRARMTLLDRFLLPFRDTARLVADPAESDPEQASVASE